MPDLSTLGLDQLQRIEATLSAETAAVDKVTEDARRESFRAGLTEVDAGIAQRHPIHVAVLR